VQAAYALGAATANLQIGVEFLRDPLLRAGGGGPPLADAVGIQVLVAQAMWSTVPPPGDGPLVGWHTAMTTVVDHLVAASDALADGVQPSTSDAEAAALADSIEQHVDASVAALAAAGTPPGAGA
jgi:hypothetical protein